MAKSTLLAPSEKTRTGLRETGMLMVVTTTSCPDTATRTCAALMMLPWTNLRWSFTTGAGGVWRAIDVTKWPRASASFTVSRPMPLVPPMTRILRGFAALSPARLGACPALLSLTPVAVECGMKRAATARTASKMPPVHQPIRLRPSATADLLLAAGILPAASGRSRAPRSGPACAALRSGVQENQLQRPRDNRPPAIHGCRVRIDVRRCQVDPAAHRVDRHGARRHGGLDTARGHEGVRILFLDHRQRPVLAIGAEDALALRVEPGRVGA